MSKIYWGILGLLLLTAILCSMSLYRRPGTARKAEEMPISIIVVDSQQKADQILQRLQSGANFADIAKTESIDATANEGGLLGKISPDGLRPELRDALAGLKVGELSHVVKIPTGYAILKVLDGNSSPNGGNSQSAKPLSVAAVGAVRYVTDVDGLQIADSALFNSPKPAGWEHDLRAICESRKQSYVKVISRLAALLDSKSHHNSQNTGTALSPQDALTLLQEHQLYAEAKAYTGDMEKSVEQYEAAYDIASAQVPQAMPQLEESLGIAFFHKAEMENEVYRRPGDRCLFPMRHDLRYSNSASSQKSIQYLRKYLDRNPNDLEAKWLLNLDYMTTGGYPDAVPKQYLLPASAFQSQEEVGRFTDVAHQTGIDLFAMAGGVIVDDFENNGRLDLVVSSFDVCQNARYFHNNGDGTFAEHTKKSGLEDQLGGLNIIQADYDNDGCTDILVLRGGWEGPMRKSLLHGNCDGTFKDVTASAGLADPAGATQTAVWVDINNDGLLDLFVGNEKGPAQLFLNKGAGRFEDISSSAGIASSTFSKAVAAADYDNDGYVDLFVSNLNGDNLLYHNNRDNTFTEVAHQAGVQGPTRGFAAWFFDYDNDGWPDLFVTSYLASVDETVRTYLGAAHNAPTLKLYKNLGDGTFRDVTKEVGLDRVFMPMGANFGDIDNDGYLDIYLGTGNPSYASVLPNVLLRNKEGKSFVDVTASSGTGELHKGHGVAFADIDNDGDEDIFAEIGGAVPGDKHAFRLFENPGNGNDWISLKLIGVKSNRSAIGTRIKVTVENEGHVTRSIYRTVNSGGSFGASPLQQHIGLGKSARILNLEISWPASNTHQNFTNIEKNQFLEIKEFAQDYARIEKKPVRLGGGGKKR